MSVMRIGLRHFLIMAWLISAPPHAMRGETGGIPQDGDLLAQARAGERKLHNGWSVSPIGQQIELNDLVLNMVLTPGGKRLIALNSGYNTHAATLIEISTGKMLQQVPLPTSWYGLAWHPNGKILYVSGGNDRNGKHAPLHVFEYKADGPEYLKRIESPAFKDTLETPAANAGAPDPNAFPMPEDAAAPVEGKDVFWAGLAHHPSKDILYAANRTAGHVVVFDSKTGRIMARIRTEVNPYDLVLSADAKTLYVSNWASRSVSIIDTEANRVRRTIPVGTNPNDMILAKDGRLFVACSSDNSVYVINTAEERAVGRIVTSLWERDPVGSTPNFLALDEATRTLYVANADNNSVAVVDITTDKETRVLGFLPTGEYPCSVVWSAETNRIVVGTAKGVGLGSNLRGPKVGAAGGGRVPPEEGNSGSTKTLMKGTVNIFRPPASADELKELTAQVYRNTPYHRDLVYEARKPEQASVVPASIGERSAIKHVIYILKENRTYDQILGDLPKGNGDPRICLFGRDVTPNHHALAEQFGIFDNFCVDAEVSVDGHSWSNAAWATDFNEKTWPADYGGKIGRAPYTAAARPPEGYLWDYCARAGITYRSYGEMTMLPSLLNHVAPDYKGWGTELDVENADAFIKEFDQYEKNYDSPDPEKRLPNFSIVSLPHDHTYGGKLGKPSVKACVAANDLALGMMVERITHSKYWKETAIFVTEDDAQDGSDHVDCHRSIALVISPYSRRGIVDSTHYDQLDLADD
ncbi:hypothetical protein HY256_07885 [Candidatus Sumerlaeota bacterium]|nr:hypothetical protein [Candidatus Sumerlaeota bacterium]